MTVPMRTPPGVCTTGWRPSGADLLVQVLERAKQGPLQAQMQDADGVSYADKVQKADAAIDWQRSGGADRLQHPGFRSDARARGQHWGDEVLKLWRAAPFESGPHEQALPGTVLSADANGIVVACGQDALCVQELQRAGGKRLGCGDFLRGLPMAVGTRLGSAAQSG